MQIQRNRKQKKNWCKKERVLKGLMLTNTG